MTDLGTQHRQLSPEQGQQDTMLVKAQQEASQQGMQDTMKLFYQIASSAATTQKCNMCVYRLPTISEPSTSFPRQGCTERVRKRRLTFALIEVVIGTAPSLTSKERNRYWWSKDDLIHFRENAKAVTMSVRKHASSLVTTIDESYKAARCLSSRLGTDWELENLVQPLNTISPHTLEKWTTNGHGRRGLERYISTFQRRIRVAQIRKARAIVLGNSRVGASDEVIAQAYAKHCRENCIYSRWLGSADEFATFSSNALRDHGSSC
jgi:hypothetical protein